MKALQVDRQHAVPVPQWLDERLERAECALDADVMGHDVDSAMPRGGHDAVEPSSVISTAAAAAYPPVGVIRSVAVRESAGGRPLSTRHRSLPYRGGGRSRARRRGCRGTRPTHPRHTPDRDGTERRTTRPPSHLTQIPAPPCLEHLARPSSRSFSRVWARRRLGVFAASDLPGQCRTRRSADRGPGSVVRGPRPRQFPCRPVSR